MNMLYRDYVEIIFLYSLLTTSKDRGALPSYGSSLRMADASGGADDTGGARRVFPDFK